MRGDYLSNLRDERNILLILTEIFNLSNKDYKNVLLEAYNTIQKYTQEKMAKEYLDNIF